MYFCIMVVQIIQDNKNNNHNNNTLKLQNIEAPNEEKNTSGYKKFESQKTIRTRFFTREMQTFFEILKSGVTDV